VPASQEKFVKCFTFIFGTRENTGALAGFTQPEFQRKDAKTQSRNENRTVAEPVPPRGWVNFVSADSARRLCAFALCVEKLFSTAWIWFS
jgi:hypothetical protein